MSEKKRIGVGVIGCGLIGQKRIKNLPDNCNLISICDKRTDRVKMLNLSPAIKVHYEYDQILSDPAVNLVIIATTNQQLYEIAKRALDYGKHLLIEKPGCRTLDEIRKLQKLSDINPELTIRIGYNHDYLESHLKYFTLSSKKEVGELMFVRARYGHGGRLGYESEWRADPAVSGGGELLDQGCHLIQFAQRLFGKLKIEKVITTNSFWKMPTEDNAFGILSDDQRRIFQFHVSCCEWKNIYCIEIYHKYAKFVLEGLGGSYGSQCIKFFKMEPEMGPPNSIEYTFKPSDNSWHNETKDVCDDIINNSNNSSNLDIAVNTFEIITEVYNANDPC